MTILMFLSLSFIHTPPSLRLCVEGHGLLPGPPTCGHLAPGSRQELSDHSLASALEVDGRAEDEEEEEVVYEAEGRLEEFLAYDVKEM